MTYTAEYLKSLSSRELADHWIYGKYPFDWLREKCGCLVMHQHGTCLMHEKLTQAIEKLPSLYLLSHRTIDCSAIQDSIEEIIRLRKRFDRLYPKGLTK